MVLVGYHSGHELCSGDESRACHLGSCGNFTIIPSEVLTMQQKSLVERDKIKALSRYGVTVALGIALGATPFVYWLVFEGWEACPLLLK